MKGDRVGNGSASCAGAGSGEVAGSAGPTAVGGDGVRSGATSSPEAKRIPQERGKPGEPPRHRMSGSRELLGLRSGNPRDMSVRYVGGFSREVISLLGPLLALLQDFDSRHAHEELREKQYPPSEHHQGVATTMP